MSKRKRKEAAGTADPSPNHAERVEQALNLLVFKRPDLERDVFTIAREGGLKGTTAYIQRMRRYRKTAEQAFASQAAGSGNGQ